MIVEDMKSQILAEAKDSLYAGGTSDKEHEPGESCCGFARCPPRKFGFRDRGIDIWNLIWTKMSTVYAVWIEAKRD